MILSGVIFLRFICKLFSDSLTTSNASSRLVVPRTSASDGLGFLVLTSLPETKMNRTTGRWPANVAIQSGGAPIVVWVVDVDDSHVSQE